GSAPNVRGSNRAYALGAMTSLAILAQAEVVLDGAALGFQRKQEYLGAPLSPTQRGVFLRKRMLEMKNEALEAWVKSVAEVTTPDEVVWCDGSDAEMAALEAQMVADGTFIELNPTKYPHSFLHRSSPNDVARTEHLTFICSAK